MSVSDGQQATAANFNSSFMDRQVDTNTTGRVDLENEVAESGPTVTNAQRSLNGAASFTGANALGTFDQLPAWSTDNTGSPGDNVKQRVDAVQAKAEANAASVTSKMETDFSNSVASANDIDLGAFNLTNVTSILETAGSGLSIQSITDSVFLAAGTFLSIQSEAGNINLASIGGDVRLDNSNLNADGNNLVDVNSVVGESSVDLTIQSTNGMNLILDAAGGGNVNANAQLSMSGNNIINVGSVINSSASGSLAITGDVGSELISNTGDTGLTASGGDIVLDASGSLKINDDSTSGASIGHVLTLQNTSTGECEWAASGSATTFIGDDGTVTNPSHSFTSDIDTGFYLPSVGELAVTANGVKKASFSAGGFTVETAILPVSNTNFDIGGGHTSSFRNLYIENVRVREEVSLGQLNLLLKDGQTSPSGVTNNSVLTSGANNRNIGVWSANFSTASPTGSVNIESGNNLGAGNSGAINIRTGTGAVRGGIELDALFIDHNQNVSNQVVWENGVTGSRPGSPVTGQRYFDTTLGLPIWYDGTNWIDAAGATV